MDTSLFILAHPDDDLMVWPMLRAESKTHHVVVVYTADTDQPGSQIRRKEALRTLSPLDLYDVQFIVVEAGNTDAKTIDIADNIAAQIARLAEQHSPVTRITTHALEGGHPDHDIAFCIASGLASKLDDGAQSVLFRAVPFYRKHPISILPFTVHRPLPDLAQHIFRSSGLKNIMILLAARHYKSQIIVLLALLPLLTLKLVLRGGLLYHVERNPEVYLLSIENPVMIERQYRENSEEFYARLRVFWERHQRISD